MFLLFGNYLPLEKGGALHLNKLDPLHPRMHCAKLGWNLPSGSGEGDENVKSLQQRQRQRGRTTNKFWSEKLTWAFGSGELKPVRKVHICIVQLIVFRLKSFLSMRQVKVRSSTNIDPLPWILNDFQVFQERYLKSCLGNYQ